MLILYFVFSCSIFANRNSLLLLCDRDGNSAFFVYLIFFPVEMHMMRSVVVSFWTNWSEMKGTVCFASTTGVLSVYPVCHFVLLFCGDFNQYEIARTEWCSSGREMCKSCFTSSKAVLSLCKRLWADTPRKKKIEKYVGFLSGCKINIFDEYSIVSCLARVPGWKWTSYLLPSLNIVLGLGRLLRFETKFPLVRYDHWHLQFAASGFCNRNFKLAIGCWGVFCGSWWLGTCDMDILQTLQV